MTTTVSSVTDWLRALEQGRDDSAQKLWDRFSPEMHVLAKQRMRRLKNRVVVDEEDIVQNAFASFCLAARNGQYSTVANRNELWGLLVVITLRKVGQQGQYTAATKRGAGQLLDQAARREAVGSKLERIATDSDDPAIKLVLAEEAEVLLSKLDDQELRSVAVMRLAGHTNDEIADALGYTRRTVQRMLAVIRSTWEDGGEPQ